MNKVKEVMKNLFVGIVFILIVLTLVLCCFSFISELNSVSESQYLIRAENHKYYTDSYTETENGISFIDAVTKQNVVIHGNAVIETRKKSGGEAPSL